MRRAIHTTHSIGYTISLFALLSSLLLVACDNAALQLCGEYACVAYHGDCAGSHNSCTEPRRCESAGSIRDRAPRIINLLREAQRSCASGINKGESATLIWDDTLASVSVSHTRDMADNQFESFVGSNGLSTSERAIQAGINSLIITESISVGPQTTAEAINYWLDINTDCQQLVNSQTSRIGMSCAVSSRSETGPYWSVLLAGPQATQTLR